MAGRTPLRKDHNEGDLKRWLELDSRIVATSRNIKVLSRLSWPIEIQQLFLEQWAKGNPALPSVEYPVDDLADSVAELGAICDALANDDRPLPTYLWRTADSYRELCHLLQHAGKPEMLEHSINLYGSPDAPLSGGSLKNIDAAQHFVDISDEYYRLAKTEEADYCLSATLLQTEMTRRLDEVFQPGMVSVAVDPHMASKAAAGATRIRLRQGTCFSEYDLEQLLQHEAFVHSLTALNGRAQPHFKSLSLGAPRTTAAQEGLATFAELITGAIDINRMERIALRVVAIERVLNGADFIETFEYFLSLGNNEMESFNSAMRIFRGAPLTGGAAFTKDSVYLHGLMEVHTFFRWAMQHQRLGLCRHLFAGRMTIADVIRLEPLFEDGTLAEPVYLPPWMVKTNGLAGYLAFSVFANKISIPELDEEHAFHRISDMGI
ncbi:MAG: DUF1704 domain-containing protein [Gammaproteobacteria bacterium]|nr:DUF1704 domain-containing protein [Gammaproteobacteria bacterium]